MSKESRNFFADKDIQVILGTLLRVGVISSMCVVLIGGLIYLFSNSYTLVDYKNFDPDKSGLSSIAAIFLGLLDLNGAAIIQFGTLLLIFTPVLRVVFSIFSF